MKNKWGSPIYLATVTLSQGAHTKQVQTTEDGRFDISLDHDPFAVNLKLTATSNIYKTVEKSFSSKDHLKALQLTMEEQPEPTVAEMRKLRLKGMSLKEAKDLADILCRQLPNISAFPLKGNFIGDDIHDSLVLLSGVAQPCLIQDPSDPHWMPDVRMEPKADFHTGDAALWILSDAGLDWGSVIEPLIDPKKYEAVGVFEYFDWVNKANHRKIVQQAVKQWLEKNPQCCGSESDFSPADEPSKNPGYQAPPERLANLQRAMAKLKPGMDEKQALQLLGPPDAVANLKTMNCMIDSGDYEKSAAFYFVEAHRMPGKAFDCRYRDPLSDRYVTIFFSGNGKFVRAFSNVAQIPPIFPANEKLWFKLYENGLAQWEKEDR